jgi:hypothetical protein
LKRAHETIVVSLDGEGGRAVAAGTDCS